MSDLRTHLYFRAPVWAQNLLVSGYGVVLRRRRYGGVHRAELQRLLETQWLGAEAMERLQLESLNRQIGIARGIPVYQSSRLPERLSSLADLRALPMLTKDHLRRPRDELVPRTAERRGLLEVHTGGTTGTPLSVYCDRATLQRNFAFFERFKHWAGVGRRGARVATFAGRTTVPAEQAEPPYWRRNFAARTMLFSSYHISERTLPDYVGALRAFRPTVIDSYPSSIEPIARYLLARGITDLRPAAIITSSETLSDEVRALVERAFGCRVSDHYGSAEMVALIAQCEHGTYHPNPEFGIVEIVRDGAPVAPGETGEIVATGFINPVMPLIRYATGDHAVLADRSCACGRAFPIVERLEGRRDDVLITPEGRLIGRLDPIFKSVRSFYETRLVQTSPTHVRVETVPAAEYDAADEEVLLAELRRRLGPSMTVDLVQVDSIPRTRSGKFRAVVNQVHGPSQTAS